MIAALPPTSPWQRASQLFLLVLTMKDNVPGRSNAAVDTTHIHTLLTRRIRPMLLTVVLILLLMLLLLALLLVLLLLLRPLPILPRRPPPPPPLLRLIFKWREEYCYTAIPLSDYEKYYTIPIRTLNPTTSGNIWNIASCIV